MPSVRVVVCSLLVATAATAQSPASSACQASATSSRGARDALHLPVGASVAVIDSTALTPFIGRTLSEALTARLPGVSVMRSSGVAGTGSRVWLRGPSGLLLTQQPVLYIDGLRADGELQSIMLNAGGQAPSRLDDIPVDDVDCIYVLRGPATTARYGTDAAGGVIHVITHRTRSDSSRVSAFIEGGATSDVGDYPANVSNANGCTRARAALGQCVTAPLRSWSPLDAETPFRTAPHVVGGGRATLASTARWSLGVNGTGVIDDGAFRENRHREYTAGANATVHPDTNLTIRGDLWFMGGNSRLPQVGPLIYSILNSALLGNSVDDSVRRGYRAYPLSLLEGFGTDQHLSRLGGIARIDWQPNRWFSVTALAGREDSRVRDAQLDPVVSPGQIPPGSIVPRFKATGERRAQRSSARVSADATYGVSALRLSTEVTLDYLAETDRRETRSFDATGQLPDGSSSYRAFDATTKGVTVRQAVASSDRRFLEVGVRRDFLKRSFFNLRNPTYPVASVAWDLGREQFFPPGRAISSLRLRSAYGESGDSRPYNAAFELAFSVPAVVGQSVAPSPVERTREVEGGVDIGLAAERVLLSATYFSKRTSDALVEQPIAPGVGVPGFSNITPDASWQTRGTELAARVRLFDAANVGASIGLTFTSLDNEVTSLGNAPTRVATAYRIAEGYPLYGAWARRFNSVDANGDGVIVPAEVTVDAEASYLGSPVPTREIGVTPSITLGRMLIVSALVDYRGGFRSANSSGRLRCNAVCSALYDPSASPADQARAVDPSRAFAGWIEDASFVRLRELSVAWTVPAMLTRKVGARSSTLVLAGRNLATSTSYSGLDPEVSYTGQTRINQEEFFTLPLPRTIALRLQLGW